MTTVSLREWETRGPEPGSVLADCSLAADSAARQLAEKLTDTGRMEVLELKRGLELRATSCRTLCPRRFGNHNSPENPGRSAAKPLSLRVRTAATQSLWGCGFCSIAMELPRLARAAAEAYCVVPGSSIFGTWEMVAA